MGLFTTELVSAAGAKALAPPSESVKRMELATAPRGWNREMPGGREEKDKEAAAGLTVGSEGNVAVGGLADADREGVGSGSVGEFAVEPT